MRFLQNLMRVGRWFSVTNKSCLLAHNLFRIKILDKAYSFNLIRLAEKIEWKEIDECMQSLKSLWPPIWGRYRIKLS